MAWLKKSLQHVTRAAALVGGIGIALLLLLVCVQVFARYVLHKPMGWVIPVVEYSVVMLTFLAIAWLEQRDRHIRIEILVEVLGRRTRLALQRTTALLAPLVSLVLALVGLRVVYDLDSRGIFTEDLLEIPLAPLIAIIPLGLLLLTVEQLISAHRLWRRPPDTPGELPGHHDPGIG